MDVFGKEYDLRKAVVRRCSVKKVFLEISQNLQENTCARVYFLIKLQASACNFINKETLEQVFSCESCEISKNPFSYRTPLVAASDLRMLAEWVSQWSIKFLNVSDGVFSVF